VHYEEIPTPALTIDLSILERNLDRFADYCRARPAAPYQDSQDTEVARMQMD
jgi:D-serine deaminase-like pyridoxal phosphate-dependent protein